MTVSAAGDRPRTLVGVAGTATEVGKTWLTARLLERLNARGVVARARKPVQSFAEGDPDPTDAEVLAAAAGEDPLSVCPEHRWYPVAMAPPMAADALGRPAPELADLMAELRWPIGPTPIGFVESVGGVRSPITDDADSADLIRATRVDLVVLVADAGLGVIDSVRGAMGALTDISPIIVFLNRFDESDDLHRRNETWLRTRDGFDVCSGVDGLVDRLVRG